LLADAPAAEVLAAELADGDAPSDGVTTSRESSAKLLRFR
jgi:hypothetical protein